MKILAPPGVFRPRSDTWLLAEALRAQTIGARTRVLDVCAGSGALAVSAALRGARRVTAVDVSRRALLAVRLNARVNGVRVRTLRGDLFAPVAGERFDLIVSNPPYLPAAEDELPRGGAARAWDAGRDGRVLLDRICEQAPAHVRPGGTILLVHSSLCDGETTLRMLERGGLEAEVLTRRHGPLGPVLAGRARMLERRGLLAPGAREEDVLVIRGTAPRRVARPAAAHAARR
jgi:release factor glutamine methyltransferase